MNACTGFVRLSGISVILGFIAAPAVAEEFWVVDSGGATGGGVTSCPDTAECTYAWAAGLAEDGDTIVLREGSYSLATAALESGVDVRGESPASREDVLLEAAYHGWGFSIVQVVGDISDVTIVQSTNVGISNDVLWVQTLTPSDSGGIYSSIIEMSVVVQNFNFGGVGGGDLTLKNNIIHNPNSFTTASGISLGKIESSLIVENNTFTGFDSGLTKEPSFQLVSSPTLVIQNNIFHGNDESTPGPDSLGQDIVDAMTYNLFMNDNSATNYLNPALTDIDFDSSNIEDTSPSGFYKSTNPAPHLIYVPNNEAVSVDAGTGNDTSDCEDEPEPNGGEDAYGDLTCTINIGAYGGTTAAAIGADEDGDLILDEYEFTDPANGTLVDEEDTDGDLLSDYDEIVNLDTDPLLADEDTDGLLDGIEQALIGAGTTNTRSFATSEARDFDSDGDGDSDLAEIAMAIAMGADPNDAEELAEYAASDSLGLSNETLYAIGLDSGGLEQGETSGDCDTEEDACTLEFAADSALPGDTIILAAGEYNLDSTDRLPNYVDIQGAKSGPDVGVASILNSTIASTSTLAFNSTISNVTIRSARDGSNDPIVDTLAVAIESEAAILLSRIELGLIVDNESELTLENNLLLSFAAANTGEDPMPTPDEVPNIDVVNPGTSFVIKNNTLVNCEDIDGNLADGIDTLCIAIHDRSFYPTLTPWSSAYDIRNNIFDARYPLTYNNGTESVPELQPSSTIDNVANPYYIWNLAGVEFNLIWWVDSGLYGLDQTRNTPLANGERYNPNPYTGNLLRERGMERYVDEYDYVPRQISGAVNLGNPADSCSNEPEPNGDLRLMYELDSNDDLYLDGSGDPRILDWPTPDGFVPMVESCLINMGAYGNTSMAMTSQDTDGDLLSDDQEIAQGTDFGPRENDNAATRIPYSAKDTDLDGVSDYDEVRLGRNPLVAEAYDFDTDEDGYSDILELARVAAGLLDPGEELDDQTSISFTVHDVDDNTELATAFAAADPGDTIRLAGTVGSPITYTMPGNEIPPMVDIVSAASDPAAAILQPNAGGWFASGLVYFSGTIDSITLTSGVNWLSQRSLVTLVVPNGRLGTVQKSIFNRGIHIWGALDQNFAYYDINGSGAVLEQEDRAVAYGQVVLENNFIALASGTSSPLPPDIGLQIDTLKAPIVRNNTFVDFADAVDYVSALPRSAPQAAIRNNIFVADAFFKDDNIPADASSIFGYNLWAWADTEVLFPELDGINGNFVAEYFPSSSGADIDEDFWFETDYHLAENSIGVDAGDPRDDVGAEPQQNGLRINVGYYGGTTGATELEDGGDSDNLSVDAGDPDDSEDDTDGDGYDDYYEVMVLGTDPEAFDSWIRDTDEDGYWDVIELAQSSDPADVSSTPDVDVLWVDDTPAGAEDCSSSSDPCSLDDANTAAEAGDTIRLMPGTYDLDSDDAVAMVTYEGQAGYRSQVKLRFTNKSQSWMTTSDGAIGLKSNFTNLTIEDNGGTHAVLTVSAVADATAMITHSHIKMSLWIGDTGSPSAGELVIQNNVMELAVASGFNNWYGIADVSITGPMSVINNTIVDFAVGVLGKDASPAIYRNNIIATDRSNANDRSSQGLSDEDLFSYNVLDSDSNLLVGDTNVEATITFDDGNAELPKHIDYAVEQDSVDKGDESDDWSNENIVHGERINAGAYGNTVNAAISTDADNDWVADWLENGERYGTSTDLTDDGSGNAEGQDTDDDGYTDGEEIYTYHTDPTDGSDPASADDYDMDGDGLTAAQEAYFGSSDSSLDSDGDGVSDRDEIVDADEDGYNDVTGEVVLAGNTNPASADTDNDGIADADEYLTAEELAAAGILANPVTSPDSDFDGILDGADVCPFDPNNDEDGDGLCGNVDSCPLVANTAADIEGDLCNLTVLTSSASGEGPDYDSDGVQDSADNCKYWPNADQTEDASHPGIGDACFCGDIDQSGGNANVINASDYNMIDDDDEIRSLSLAQLERCDVTGDGVCSSEDRAAIYAYVNSSTPLPQEQCASIEQISVNALNRIGYGLNDWSRDRILALQNQAAVDAYNDSDPAPDGYAGLKAFIREQIDNEDNLFNAGIPVADPEFVAKAVRYAKGGTTVSGAANPNVNAPFPTLEPGSVRGTLVSRSTSSLVADFCLEAIDRAKPSTWCRNPIGREKQPSANAMEIKFLRNAYSRRQLNAVLLDFWWNHFSVRAKDPSSIREGLNWYEQIIQDTMWTQFEDMVNGSMNSLSMASYLNQEDNIAEFRNENYARELMELHTVGVSRDIDGTRALTYDDTIELSGQAMIAVSRILTGQAQTDTVQASLTFRATRPLCSGNKSELGYHDLDAKEFEMGGVTWDDWGDETSCTKELINTETELLVEKLARHDMTADQVVRKLMVRLMGDGADEDCPSTFTDNCTLREAVKDTWETTYGDLPDVVRRIVGLEEDSGEYDYVSNASNYFLKSLFVDVDKVKRPTAVTASLVRALGNNSEGETAILDQLYHDNFFAVSYRGLMAHHAKAGEEMYAAAPPTGYPEDSSGWNGVTQVMAHFRSIDDALKDDAAGDLQLANIRGSLTARGVDLDESSDVVYVASIAKAMGVMLAPSATPATTVDHIADFVDGATGDDERLRRALVGILSSPEFLAH